MFSVLEEKNCMQMVIYLNANGKSYLMQMDDMNAQVNVLMNVEVNGKT